MPVLIHQVIITYILSNIVVYYYYTHSIGKITEHISILRIITKKLSILPGMWSNKTTQNKHISSMVHSQIISYCISWLELYINRLSRYLCSVKCQCWLNVLPCTCRSQRCSQLSPGSVLVNTHMTSLPDPVFALQAATAYRNDRNSHLVDVLIERLFVQSWGQYYPQSLQQLLLQGMFLHI